MYTLIEQTEQERRAKIRQAHNNSKDGSFSTPQSSAAEKSTWHRSILLNNTVFSENVLGKAGPIIIFSHLDDIKLCCGPNSTCKTGEDLLGNNCMDTDLRKQGYWLLGTYFRGMEIYPKIIGPDSEYVRGNVLPVLNVTLLDAFGNMANTHAHLKVTSTDIRVGLLGPLSSGILINGTANISGITLIGRPGMHYLNVTVTANEGGSRTIVGTVSVFLQECRIGEQAINDNTECGRCDEYFYNFFPGNSSCTPCPQEKSRCNGMALAPLDGYWHKSSHSDMLVPCLNENACKYPNRTETLMARAEENITVDLTWSDGYPLCHNVQLHALLRSFVPTTYQKCGICTCTLLFTHMFDWLIQLQWCRIQCH